MVLEKKTLKVFNNVFFLFPNYLPFGKGVALCLNKLDFPSPNDALCQIWLKLAQWFWRRIFLKVVNLFLLFPNYPYFRKGVALYLNKLEIPSPRNTLCQVWLKMSQWFWTKRLLKVFNNVFLLFCNYLHFEKGATLHLNKPELYSPTDALCQVWLKMA